MAFLLRRTAREPEPAQRNIPPGLPSGAKAGNLCFITSSDSGFFLGAESKDVARLPFPPPVLLGCEVATISVSKTKDDDLERVTPQQCSTLQLHPGVRVTS